MHFLISNPRLYAVILPSNKTRQHAPQLHILKLMANFKLIS